MLVVSTAGLWCLLFAAAGWLVYGAVRHELETAMDGRLAAAARLLAAEAETSIPKGALMEPASAPDPVLARLLKDVSQAGLAEDLVLLGPQGLVLLDATGEAVPGFAERSLSPADWAELKAGRTVVHAPAEAPFGALSQSAYAPLSGGAVLELRADPSYLAVLSGFRSACLWAGVVGMLVSGLLGAVLAAWILSPLKWLERAAEQEPPQGGSGHEWAQAARAAAGEVHSLTRENLQAQQLREHAERRNEELRQVASAIAHEVRNPLTVIRGQADLLGRILGPQPAAEGPLDSIRRQVTRLDAVVGRFLELGRTPRLEMRRVDMGTLLARLAESLRQGVPADSYTFACAAPEGCQGLADATLLEGALLNLGLNAVQAMPHGGQVELALKIEKDRLVFEVRDHGAGFAPGAKERLFEPFFTTKPQGSGLGLALARRAALAHGGGLEAENAIGGGALFRLWLPFQADES